MDQTTIHQAKINQFDKHVEILEEQCIDKEIDVPEVLQRKVPAAQTVHREQWRCIIKVQSVDTVDNTSVNRQRQVPRTGTAQWQDPEDVRCEATQIPMIQKMQKTVKILQVPHIDKEIEVPQAQLIDEAVEVPEIMWRHDPMIQKVEDAQKT